MIDFISPATYTFVLFFTESPHDDRNDMFNCDIIGLWQTFENTSSHNQAQA